MALNYNLQAVEADYKDDAVWPITNALIWGTMSVAMGSITEDNWKEFYPEAEEIIPDVNDKLEYLGPPVRITAYKDSTC